MLQITETDATLAIFKNRHVSKLDKTLKGSSPDHRNQAYYNLKYSTDPSRSELCLR